MAKINKGLLGFFGVWKDKPEEEIRQKKQQLAQIRKEFNKDFGRRLRTHIPSHHPYNKIPEPGKKEQEYDQLQPARSSK